MLAGESGADYVMFGEPTRPPAAFRRRDRARRLVDGMFTDSLRRLCGERRRGRGARAGGRRIRRGRRGGLARRASRSCSGGRGLPRSPCDEQRLLILWRRRSAPSRSMARGAQPMQITPPVARPPASIPAKPRNRCRNRRPRSNRRSRPPPNRRDQEVHRRAEPSPRRSPAAPPTAFAPENRAAAALHRAGKARADAHQDDGVAARARSRPQGDIAYGAYQRGYYLEAFREATRRASEQGDPVAMTLLGELYANGYGVARDEKKALDWYSLAADRGDRQAIFALAMFRFAGRGGAAGPGERPRRCSTRPPSSATSPPPTISRCSISRASSSAGHRARRRTVAHRGRRRQPGGAVRARDALQGRQRRRRRTRSRPRSCSARPRARQHATRRSNTPSRCSTAPASPRTKRPRPRCSARRAQQGQCGGAEPAGAHSGDRSRPAGRSRRGDQMAHHRQGRRRLRHLAGKLHAADQGSERAAGENAARLWLAHAKPNSDRLVAWPRGDLLLAGDPKHADHQRAIRSASARVRRPFQTGTKCCPIRPAQRDDRRRPQGRRAASSATSARSRTCRSRSKGPANFVTAADRRAEEILRAELTKARPGYGFLGEEGGTREGTDKTHTLDRRSARRHHQFPARHSAFRDLDRARARGHDRRRADLQSGQRRDLHRRARQGRVPQRPPHARRGAQAARRRGRRAARCRITAAAILRCSGARWRRSRTRSPACAASARPRSISPGWRPAGSTSIGSAAFRPWDFAAGVAIVREAGGFVTDLADNER